MLRIPHMPPPQLPPTTCPRLPESQEQQFPLRPVCPVPPFHRPQVFQVRKRKSVFKTCSNYFSSFDTEDPDIARAKVTLTYLLIICVYQSTSPCVQVQTFLPPLVCRGPISHLPLECLERISHPLRVCLAAFRLHPVRSQNQDLCV